MNVTINKRKDSAVHGTAQSPVSGPLLLCKSEVLWHWKWPVNCRRCLAQIERMQGAK